MGFLFKKADKNGKKEDQSRNNSDDEGEDKGRSPNIKRRTSLKRKLSSNSMRKIRELAACLRTMGDQVEQKRLSGAYAMKDKNNEGDEDNNLPPPSVN